MRLVKAILSGAMMSAGALGAIAGSIVPASMARAQVRMGGPGGFGGAEISRASVEQYAKILHLDASQKEAALMLQETCSDATRRAGEEMQQAMKSIREEAGDGDFSVFSEKMPKVMETMGKKRSAAQQAFLKDLQELLTPEQREQWPAVERLRRRQAHLNMGMVSGSSVDMINVVDAMKLTSDQSAKLHDALVQYEYDLDRLLQERENSGGARGDSFDFDPSKFDFEKMRASMDEARAQSIKVRDLNKKYERQLAALLPDDARPKFETEVRNRSFRQVYKQPYVTKMLDAALKFDDLDATQRKQLSEMQAQYDKEVDEANRAWAAALEQAETEGKAGGMPFMGGGGESDELKSARQVRRDLDKKFTERVRTALNDKQRERLPKKDTGERMMHFGDGGEGGAVFVQSVETDEGEGVQSEVHVIVGPGGD